jgi:benzoyl-CoA reductase subunit C
MLEQMLEEIPKRQVKSNPGIRLMLIGSELDDAEFVRLVESLGANVVIDDLCTGSRYFWNEVNAREDQLSAIAARYMARPRCPDKDITLERRRLGHILNLARDYRVQAVVLILQKFCDHHEWDIPLIQSLFKTDNIPTILLELDLTIPEGQFRTRIQALLEMVGAETI